jgi:hypothetical protein
VIMARMYLVFVVLPKQACFEIKIKHFSTIYDVVVFVVGKLFDDDSCCSSINSTQSEGNHPRFKSLFDP